MSRAVVGRVSYAPPLPSFAPPLPKFFEDLLERAGLGTPPAQTKPGVVLGVDPGASTGLVVARRRQPGEAGKFGYVAVHHSTVTTEPEFTEHGLVLPRLGSYRSALAAAVAFFEPAKAYVEVAWHRQRRSKALSVYTRGNANVGSIALLIAITGLTLGWLEHLGVEVYEVPAPMGKNAEHYEEVCERNAAGLFGLELKKHEAVAAMLAIKGL